MRILCTGACGFISSHLIDTLIAQGHTVHGIDNLSTGSLDNVSEHLGPEPSKSPRPLVMSIGDVATTLPRLEHEPFDVIYHLAAHVGAKTVKADPYSLLIDHVEDGVAIVRFALHRKAILIAMSSSEVYGAQPNLPYNEEDFCIIGPPSVPRWSYGISKLWLEQLCLAAHRQHDLRVVVPRMFNVSGPRQRADTGMVLPSFAHAALSGDPITIHGDGSQRRCFSHVKDIAHVLADLPHHPALFGRVVNIGTHDVITILRVAHDVNAYCLATYGKGTKIERGAQAEDVATAQMNARKPDTGRLYASSRLSVPSNWPALVADVCDYWAGELGIAKRKTA